MADATPPEHPPVPESQPWSDRFQEVLNEINAQNIDQKLPEVLDLAKEFLHGQIDQVTGFIPQHLIPESVLSRDTLNQAAKQFVDETLTFFKNDAVLDHLPDISPSLKVGANQALDLVKKIPLAPQAINLARQHVQAVDGITCILEGLAGRSLTGEDLKQHSKKVITYGTLELIELFDTVPKTNIPIPKEVKTISRVVRGFIYTKLPEDYRRRLRHPMSSHTKHRQTQPGLVPAPAPA